MESGNKYEDLLIKYSLKECNPQEEKFVLDWLSQSESNRLYFESVTNTLNLLRIKEETAKIDVDQEWEHFKQIKNRDVRMLFEQQEQKNPNKELQDTDDNRPRSTLRWLLAAAVAASLIFGLIPGSGVDVSGPAKKPGLSNNVVREKAGSNTLPAVLLHEVNKTGRLKTFDLPDRSVTKLFPSGEITYLERSERKTREVLLSGKADFKVAKDKTKPFTVFSGDISVTALGTRFTVSAIPVEKMIVVRLEEGKVVIRSTKYLAPDRMKDVYLIPGEELLYNVSNGKGTIRKFESKPVIKADKKGPVKDIPIIPSYGKNSWFMFNNQPLNEVFDALAGMYQVKIIYPKNEVKKMYHIGTYDKSDSLVDILKKITSLNDLILFKDSSNYRIKIKALNR